MFIVIIIAIITTLIITRDNNYSDVSDYVINSQNLQTVQHCKVNKLDSDAYIVIIVTDVDYREYYVDYTNKFYKLLTYNKMLTGASL